MSNTKKDYVKRHPTSWALRVVKIVVMIIIIVSMLGLKNSSSMEHSTFVIGIGIDVSPTDPNKTLVTFQIVPPQITSQSSSDMDKVVVTSIDADSLEAAVSLIHNYLSTIVNFSHTRVVVFGQEIARQGVNEYITALTSNPSYDTNMFVMVCKETAQEYLESISQDIEVNPSLYYNIIRNSQFISGSTKAVTLMQFLQAIYDPYVEPTASLCSVTDSKEDKQASEQTKENIKRPEETQQSAAQPPGEGEQQNAQETTQGGTQVKEDTSTSSKPPEESSEEEESSEKEKSSLEGETDNTTGKTNDNIMQKSNAKIQVSGMAVFDGDKMVGSLSAEESAYYLMTTNTLKGFYPSLTHTSTKDNKVVHTNLYIWQEKRADIKVDVSQETPVIFINIPLNISILDTEKYTFDFYDNNYMNQMRDHIEAKLTQDLNLYFEKTQKEYKVDITDFSKYAKKSFINNQAMEEYHWSEKFPNATIKTSFQLKFVTSSLSNKK